MKITNKKNNTGMQLALLLLIALIMEIGVFNFRSIQSLGYKELHYPLEQLKLVNIEMDGAADYRITGEDGWGQFYVKNLQELLGGAEVRNVYLKLHLPEALDRPAEESGICHVIPYIRDGGHDRFIPLAEHIYREDIPASHFIWVKGNGPVKTLMFHVSLSEGEKIEIEEIVINGHRPVLFSGIRFLVIFCILCAIRLLFFDNVLWRQQIGMSDQKMHLAAVLFGLLLFAPAAYLMINNPYLTADNHFRPYQALAEALDAGQVSLLQKPSEALMQLKNPYDYTVRDAEGLEDGRDYLWDTVYYEGKYYAYFGVAPCVLFYLPFYHFSGTHLEDAALLFFMAGMIYIGLYLLMYRWIERRFPKTPYAIFMILFLSVYLGSFAVNYLAAVDAHDIPRFSGLMFVVWGVYFWYSSVGEEERISGWKLAAGSLCMALAVGCRPNQVCYSFLAVPMFWKAFYAMYKQKRRKAVLSVLALLGPYLPVAAALMAYNYARFGSVTDFGYAYNLTILDYRYENVYLDRILIGIYEFLFRMPRLTYHFPFLEQGTFALQDPFGHGNFYYTYGFGGLFCCNLLLWCIPAVFRKRERNPAIIWMVVLSFANMLLNICVAGVTDHYLADFALFLLLAGAAGALQLRERMDGTEGARIIEYFLMFSLAFSFVYHMNFYFISTLHMGNTALYYKIFYAFQFF